MEIKYEVKIDIQTIPVTEKLLAFKYMVYHNDTLQSEVQGIVEKAEFEKIDEFGNFKVSKYKFWHKDLLEMHRISPHNCDFDEKFIEFTNTKAYDIALTENWQKNYVICSYDGCSEDFIDVNGEYEPKAMYLDYMAGIDEQHFDLEKLLEGIKQNDQIICLSKEVERIPWYNAEEGRIQNIKFILCPTKEQYQQYCKDEMFTRRRKAITLFGLDKYRKPVN